MNTTRSDGCGAAAAARREARALVARLHELRATRQREFLDPAWRAARYGGTVEEEREIIRRLRALLPVDQPNFT